MAISFPFRARLGPWSAWLRAGARAVAARCRGPLVLERVVLPVPGLPDRLSGLRLLHISDLHLRAGDAAIADEVRAFAGLPADLTVVTGDLIEDDSGITHAVHLVRDLAGPLGTFVVLGNHDYAALGLRGVLRGGRASNDVARLCAELARAGATVLRNTWATVRTRGATLYLVGVDDPHRGRDDLHRALAGLPPTGPRLLLSHSPDILPQAIACGLRAIVAGHTHGGQVVLPLAGALTTATRVRLPRPSGLMRWREATIYVSRGVHGAIPFRLNCPPEVALIELRPAAAML